MQALTARQSRRLAARRRRREGQALILGALAMFLLALVMMATLNLGQTVHEKIALQQHADSTAYSMAVLEARAFNYFAVSNRAMAAAYVTMTSLHATMAIASSIPNAFNAGMVAFIEIALEEVGYCAGMPFPKNIPHCIHIALRIKTMLNYIKERKSYEQKVKQLEGTFRTSMTALSLMVNTIHLSQSTLLWSTANMLRGTSSEFKRLRDINAPRAKTPSAAVAALSATELACAVEGTPFLPCTRQGTSDDGLRKTMADVANATRLPKIARLSTFQMLHPTWIARFIKIPGGSFITLGPWPTMKGGAKVVHSASKGDLHGGGHSDGATIGADFHGNVFSLHIGIHWPPLVGIGFAIPKPDGQIFSNKDGGSHKPSNTHLGSIRHKFDGIKGNNACAPTGSCFVNFRVDPSRTKDFGQPAVYVAVSQKLKEDRSGTQQKPWQINATGKVKFTHGEQGTGELQLAPDEGAAMSKALVYYHRLGDWKEQPNMFLPYWRAKLHPFTRTDAALVATAAGWGKVAAAAALMVPE